MTKAADTKTETETAKVDGAVETAADAAPSAPTALEKALAEAVEGEDAPVEGVDPEIARAIRRLAKGLDAKAVLGIKDPEPVTKSEEKDPLADLPPEAKAKVEALFKAQADSAAKLEALTKALDDAKEEKEVREAVEKAAKTFPNIPGKAEDLGRTLRSIRKADAKAADAIEAALVAANALCGKNLEPIGKSDPTGEAGGTALERLNKMATERATKDKVPFAVAFDRVLGENEALYTAYEAEKRDSAKGN